MSITDFGRQLRPKDESYVPPIDKIKTILSEGKGASTYFEGVIAACHNLSNQKEKDFKKNILKDSVVKQFLKAADSGGKPHFATNGKSDEEKLDLLYNFSKVCRSRLGSGSSDAGAGQSKMKVSIPWQEMTLKKLDTSKADISVNGHQTSVKGPSAQLMSGEKKETKATVLAALEISGTGGKLRDELLGHVNNFVESERTIGAEINSRVLKSMSPEEAKKTGNEKAYEVVQKQEKMKVDITKSFESAFNDPKLGSAFAKEAMTGWEKFGGKAFPNKPAGDSKAEATHMLVWDYRMDRIKFLKIDDSFISMTAKKMKVRPDLKSNSYKVKGQKSGYSFYQALRISVDVLLNKTGELETNVKEHIEYNKNLLTEGTITEFSFKKIVSKAWNWFKEKITKLWNWFSERVKKIVNTVIETINQGIYFALQTFELDVDVKVQTTVRLL